MQHRRHDQSRVAGAGATLTLSGTASAVTADGSGNYTFSNVANGAYTVIPSKSGFAFSPTGHPRRSTARTRRASTSRPSQFQPSVVARSAPFELGIVAVNMVMMHTGKVLMYLGVVYRVVRRARVGSGDRQPVTLVPNPYYNLFCSGQSQLADGRILVVGGYAPPKLGAKNANIFDPVTQTWSALPNMAYRRWYPTSTTLPDGRALVTSGAQTCLTCLADVPEIFDPATGPVHDAAEREARRAVLPVHVRAARRQGRSTPARTRIRSATSKLDLTAGTWTTVDPDRRWTATAPRCICPARS